MSFIKEMGAILSPDRQILHWIEGTSAEVIFPQKLAWNLHQARPGIIWAFAHVHPPGLTQLSHEDETTCKAWAMALHPWPFRMITLTEIGGGEEFNRKSIVESVYLCQLETTEEWILRGKESPRKFSLELEDIKMNPEGSYVKFLWRKGYESEPFTNFTL